MSDEKDKPESTVEWLEESILTLNRRLAATEFLLVALLAKTADPEGTEKLANFMVDSVEDTMPWKDEFAGYLRDNLQAARNLGKVKL